MEYDVINCQGAACQLSPSLNSKPLSLGAVCPASTSVSSSTDDLVIPYVGGDEGRSFDMNIVCDSNVTTDPILTTNEVMIRAAHRGGGGGGGGGQLGHFSPGPSLKGGPLKGPSLKGGPLKGPLNTCLKDQYTLK